jgi:type I restriction-modification system DNA methylase subunit
LAPPTLIRKKIIEENCLDGVVSMPSGVFRPYAGVSIAVLLSGGRPCGTQLRVFWPPKREEA